MLLPERSIYGINPSLMTLIRLTVVVRMVGLDAGGHLSA
jgi:hypothetical protein